MKEFSVGERILATWADGRKYPAKVNAVLGNGKRPNLNHREKDRDRLCPPIVRLTFSLWEGHIFEFIIYHLFYYYK